MIELDPARNGDTAEVIIDVRVRATVPYYLANQGSLKRNLEYHLQQIRTDVERDAVEVTEMVLQSNIIDHKVANPT
jgi:hypothetical protein